MGKSNERAGIRWDSVVEKVWKDVGGDQEEILSIEKFAGCKTEVKEKIEIRQRLTLRNKVKEEEHFSDLRKVKRNRNENVFARANGLRENAETAISCMGPGPARKKRYASSREEEETAHMPLWQGSRVELI